MPHTITLEDHGLYRRFTGIVSGDEILSSNFDTHEMPEFNDIAYVINDFTEADGHSIELSHTSAYASSDKVIANAKGHLKIAIIVTSSDMIELANNYVKLMEASIFNCRVFSSLEDARHWTRQPKQA